MRRRQLLQAMAMLPGLQLALYLQGCDAGENNGSAVSVRSESDSYFAQMKGVGAMLEPCATALAWDAGNRLTNVEQFIEETGLVAQQPERMATSIQTMIQADFKAGDILDVSDWRLSETECKLIVAAHVLGHADEQSNVVAIQKAAFAEVENWGPQQTCVDQRFNVQPDGHAGIWVMAKGVTSSTVLMFGEERLQTHITEAGLTSGLRGEFMNSVLAEPGVHEVSLLDRAGSQRQTIGEFEVKEREPLVMLADGSRSTVFSAVEAWGPQQAQSGQGFNIQPNGSSAFWIRINCAPATTVVQLNGESLPSMVQPNLVTARSAQGDQLRAGTHQVQLFDRESGEILPVGSLQVR